MCALCLLCVLRDLDLSVAKIPVQKTGRAGIAPARRFGVIVSVSGYSQLANAERTGGNDVAVMLDRDVGILG